MKILQIIYESEGSPFGFGGAGVRAYEIYGRITERHEITLLCMKYKGAKDGVKDGLKHVFVGIENRSLTKSVLAYTFMAGRYVKKNGGNYDIIVENFLPSTPFFTKFLTSTPVVLQVQGIMEKHSFNKFSPLYSIPMYGVENVYPSFYDRLLFVSEVTRRKVMSNVSMGNAISTVIPNGVNQELLEVEPVEKPYILFFSRIDIYTKGLDILMRAFHDIADKYPDITIKLAGYEFDNASLLIARQSQKLRQRIQYVGFVSGAEKIKLLQEAMIVVLPSRHESQPVSILEAAACEKPVIVSDVEELLYVRENDIGLTFKSQDHESLASKLDQLIGDQSLRQTLGKRGRTYASKFMWDSLAQKYESFLTGFVQ
ncbi:glycosyltransferase family 4 protein [Candidatus Magnetomonas plexicatena]|uniref:glycosyltransferase family 4 protein n=1 Tax=Candidatus Magnetomonas plexicatena TaxID=2552947 RepID=UPI001C784F8A|nr:glycosyltransferase family 4 protein [Nitrospirales bacterium LBB_01]